MADTTNPYQPPQSNTVSAQSMSDALDIVPAPKGVRFATYIIDYICFMLFSLVVGMVIALVFGEAGMQLLEDTPDIIVGIPIILLYYIVLEGITGRTIGKLIMGTKVVNESGEKASFGQVIIRSLCRLIPFEGFSFLGETGRGWHDSIPKTYVVKCR